MDDVLIEKKIIQNYDKIKNEEAIDFSSPYKLSIFLLLIELENYQQRMDLGFDAELHAFLGVSLTFLIRQKHLSLTTLKCFVLRFIEPFIPLISSLFFKSIFLHTQIGIVPCTKQLFNSLKNPTFLRPKSILGMFARKVQENYSGCDLYCHNEFLNYTNTLLPDNEHKLMTETWKFDLKTLLACINEIEEKFTDMEILWRNSESKSKNCLLKALKEANDANPDNAYAYTSLYFDDLLPSSINYQENGFDVNHPSRNRCLKLGLVFTARLARIFGHYEKANYLLIEAIRFSQGSNDFIRLKLALLERGMLEITTSRFAMLGRFVRIESIFILSGNEQESAETTPSINMLSNDVNCLNTTTNLVNNLINNDNVNNGIGVIPNSDELDLCSNTKYLSQQLITCENYLKALNLAIRCESPGLVSKLIKNCLCFDVCVDRNEHSKLIREAARAFTSTVQVSLGSTRASVIEDYLIDEYVNECLPITITQLTNKSCLVNSEARAILFVNTAYAYALDGDFQKAFYVIEKAKKRFSEAENALTFYHLKVATAFIEFDFKFFNAFEVDIDLLSCFSPTESDFRFALLTANKGEYLKAIKILENRLNLLQNGIDKILIIRCLLLLGTTYCEFGAHKSGLRTLQDALYLSKISQLNLMIAMSQRRIAFAHIICNDNLDEAKNLLDLSESILVSSESPRLERGMYYITKFKQFCAEQNDINTKKDAKIAINYLNKARSTFINRYPQLEKNLYEEGYIFGEKINDKNLCNLCKTLFEEMSSSSPNYLNWFLL